MYLADLHDHDGTPIGAACARTPDILGLTLRVAAVPPRAGCLEGIGELLTEDRMHRDRCGA